MIPHANPYAAEGETQRPILSLHEPVCRFWRESPYEGRMTFSQEGTKARLVELLAGVIWTLVEVPYSERGAEAPKALEGMALSLEISAAETSHWVDVC